MELSNFEGLMMVPENIRNVQRPPNTVVVNTGNVGPKQFPVRERNGGTVINGRYHPHNGRVIGHIYNGEFIGMFHFPLEKIPRAGSPHPAPGSTGAVPLSWHEGLSSNLRCYPAVA